MSHFAVVVVTSEYPTKAVLDKALQPYHEYECTGIRDEYVVAVDLTDEALAYYEKDTTRFLIDLEGNKHSPYIDGEYDPRFLRDATEQEIADCGVFGSNRDIRLVRGPKGYDKHVFVVPEGWQDVNLLSRENGISLIENIEYNYGCETIVIEGDEIPEDAHSYIVTDADGNFKKFFKFTNPNKKWDWWQVGGRYTGRLSAGYDPEKDPRNLEYNRYKRTASDPNMVPKWPTEWVKFEGDIIQKGALNFDKIFAAKKIEFERHFDRLISMITDFDFRLWSEITEGKNYGDKQREEYHSQQAVKALNAEWIEAPTMKYFRDKDREGYTKDRASVSVVPYAFVHEGKWYEGGEMGWFGVSHGDMEQSDWSAQFMAMFESLKDTDYLTVVDCHI